MDRAQKGTFKHYLGSLLAGPVRALGESLRPRAIDSPEALTAFLQTRSAYIAQTTLYGYLKVRMGTQYRSFFEDEVFSQTMRTSATRIFVSCLSDLTVFAVARIGKEASLSDREILSLAHYCFSHALAQAHEEGAPGYLPPDAESRFSARLEETHWPTAAVSREIFRGSEQALLRYAPVVPAYKEEDETMVQNSIRFKWRDIREQFTKRCKTRSITESWRQRS